MKKYVLVIFILTFSHFSTAADIAKGKAKSISCTACHGPKGISLIPIYPNLRGQKAQYAAKQLKAFRDGKRSDPVMSAMAKPLTDEDIDNLAAYFASLK